jgi:hypothetical protein
MEVSEIVAIILTLAKYLVIGVTILLCMFILIALFKPLPKHTSKHDETQEE